MAKDECPRCVQKIAGWMATFSDMSTLLLTFFILLLTMIEEGVPAEEVNTIVNAFSGGQGNAGGQTLSKGKMADMGMTVQSLPSQTQGNNMGKAQAEAELILKKQLNAKQVEITNTKNGFAVNLIGSLYFAPGEAQLNKEGLMVLDKVKELIMILKKQSIDNGIRVKGFADGGLIAPDSRYYAHNLELTTARSNNVIYYFLNQGVDPRRLYNGRSFAKFQSIGYGEFQPEEANSTPEQRAHNRKVQIEFLQDPDAY